MKDIAVVIVTRDRTPLKNYLPDTLAALARSGVLVSDRLHSLQTITSNTRTASENVAATLHAGADTGAPWVLFLEDDVDVCADFLGSVGRWLDQYAHRNTVFSFSVPHSAINLETTQYWKYPIEYFCCTQALAMRREDAQSLAEYLDAHPTYTGHDGGVSTGAYDLHIRDWARQRWPAMEFFGASNPSFVQHVGYDSVITPGRSLIVMPNWPGREWKYEPHVEVVARRRKVLWVGDAACDSGFAKCTHETLETVRQEWDVAVLGINYRGEPHKFPYKIYPASLNGANHDFIGSKRLPGVIMEERPDLVIFQNDPWHIPSYTRMLEQMAKGGASVPALMGIIAVDGLNCLGANMNKLQRSVFWTRFAENEARLGGMTCPSAVVGLGVDLEKFTPGDARIARRKLGLVDRVVEGFIVGRVDRNQPRKRMDLTIRYFAHWVQQYDIPPDVFLYLHVCPTGEVGVRLNQLAKYYGIANTDLSKTRLILSEPDVYAGLSEAMMVETFRAFDVSFSTTQGEGWHLPTMEAMACGVPVIAPRWSALGEWADPAAHLVPCSSTAVASMANAIGGIMDEEQAISALNAMYSNERLRREHAERGLALVAKDEFRWPVIGQRILEEMHACLHGTPQVSSSRLASSSR